MSNDTVFDALYGLADQEAQLATRLERMAAAEQWPTRKIALAASAAEHRALSLSFAHRAMRFASTDPQRPGAAEERE